MIRCFKTLVMAVVALAAAAGDPQAGEPAAFDASGSVNIDELFQLAQANVTVPGRGCGSAEDCQRQEITCRNRCVESSNICGENCYNAEVSAQSNVLAILPPTLLSSDPRYEQAWREYNQRVQQMQEQERRQQQQAASVRRQCDQGCRNTKDQCEHTCSQIYGYSN